MNVKRHGHTYHHGQSMRTFSLILALLLGLALAGTMPLVSPERAQAATPEAPNLLTWVPSGDVLTIAHYGTTTYIGGYFRSVGPPSGGGVPLDLATGDSVPGYPKVSGRVFKCVSDGSGGYYIAGLFNAVGGVARNNLAHIRSDLSVDPEWDPDPDDAVETLAVSGSSVYAGGWFTSIGGQSRNGLAKLDAGGTGVADATWDPNPDSSVTVIAPSGSNLYVGGYFGNIGGQSRARLAKLSATGTGAADATWDPSPNSSVETIAVSGDGNSVFVGGNFFGIGGQSRNRIAKLSATGTGAADATWDPNASDQVSEIVVSGSSVFVSGGFFNVGGLPRSRLAKLSATGTGAADATWDPNPDDGIGQLAVSGSNLYVVGYFSTIGGQSLTRIAKLSATGTGAADPAWDPRANDNVDTLAISGSTLYVGGGFSSIGHEWVTRNYVAAINDVTGEAKSWDPNADGVVSSLVMSADGNSVFAGGSFFNIGGQSRNRVAKLSATGTGAADATWDPNANNEVYELAMSGDGNSVFVGGLFSGVGGQSRNGIAKLSTTGTGTADATWDPNADDSVRVLALSGDGNSVYASGNFANIGAQSRNGLAKLSATGTGAADATWDPNPNDSVEALAASGSSVYAGGYFTNIGGLTRRRIAKLSATGTGTADATWDPNAIGSVGALVISGSSVYAGGEYTRIGGKPRNGLARLSATGTGAADATWDPKPGFDMVEIRSLASNGDFLYVGGSFSTMGLHSASSYAQFGYSALPPVVTSISPNSALNDGPVSITDLAGTAFEDPAMVSLRKSGQADIFATGVSVNPAGTRITCDFDITGAAAGAWDVYVENPDGQNDTAVGAFTVTAPTSPSTFFFAEGYTGPGFDEYLCLGNPGEVGTFATITYMFKDGTTQEQEVEIGAKSRATVYVNGVVPPGSEVSAMVGCDQPIVAERPMYFDYTAGGGSRTGGHDTVGAQAPADAWYFAEGYTGPGFDEYVCVLNPGDTIADLSFYFQTQSEGEKYYTGMRVGPHSRETFRVNDMLGGTYETSLLLRSDEPVVAERPMYFDYLGTSEYHWTGGHCVMGTPSLANSYYFAEGYTGAGFDEYLTIQNPGDAAIEVVALYQLGQGQGGPVPATYAVPAKGRRTVYVNGPEGVGPGVDVSVYLSSTSPFLAERPMYFNYSGMGGHAWTGGHCVIGAVAEAADWFFAEGYTGGGFEEWLCIQNAGAADAQVTVTYYPEGGTHMVKEPITVAANSRRTIYVNGPEGAGPDLAISAEVTSTHPIIVERPMYFSYGAGWTGGHDVLGFVP
jgi:hypothetical protein